MAMHKSHRGAGGRSDDGTGQRPAVSTRRPAAPGSRGPVVEGNEPQGDGIMGDRDTPSSNQYRSLRGGKSAAQYAGPGSVTENPKGRE